MISSIVKGSLSDLSHATGRSIADAFVSADVIVLVDVSGSMEAADTPGGQSRYEAACAELAKLQAANPGKLAIVAFSREPAFAPTGKPPMIGGGTNLAGALKFVRGADGTVDYIVISDGQPDDERAALDAVRGWMSKISTIYVGPADGSGERFLSLLAKEHRGQHVRASQASQLAQAAQAMLPTAR